MPSVQTNIDWAASYSSSWRVSEVNPITWASARPISGIVEASVTRDLSGDMLESCRITAVTNDDFPIESWVRIEVLANQGGVVERNHVMTALARPISSTFTRTSRTVVLECSSVLKPPADERLLSGTYVPKGADGAEWAARYISECTPAPVVADGSFSLNDNVVFSASTSKLEAALMLLDSAGWMVQIEGSGAAYVRPKPTNPSLTIDRRGLRLISTEVDANDDPGNLPNRLTAWLGDSEATVVDDDPDSITSHAATGRWVDVVEESPQLVDGETLQAYARRRLSELSKVVGTRQYVRAWVPGITVGDVVHGSVPEAALVGSMRVSQQSVTLGAGIAVNETLEVLR